jgi:hypothetical protein
LTEKAAPMFGGGGAKHKLLKCLETMKWRRLVRSKWLNTNEGTVRTGTQLAAQM